MRSRKARPPGPNQWPRREHMCRCELPMQEQSKGSKDAGQTGQWRRGPERKGGGMSLKWVRAARESMPQSLPSIHPIPSPPAGKRVFLGSGERPRGRAGLAWGPPRAMCMLRDRQRASQRVGGGGTGGGGGDVFPPFLPPIFFVLDATTITTAHPCQAMPSAMHSVSFHSWPFSITVITSVATTQAPPQPHNHHPHLGRDGR